MTEDEAKTKWCPMSRSLFPDHNTCGNRNYDGSLTRTDNCVGSACMMWRWLMVPNPEWAIFDHDLAPEGSAPPAWLESKTDGLCGLVK
jgi:hypothetical protein